MQHKIGFSPAWETHYLSYMSSCKAVWHKKKTHPHKKTQNKVQLIFQDLVRQLIWTVWFCQAGFYNKECWRIWGGWGDWGDWGMGHDFSSRTRLHNTAIIVNCSLQQCTVETFAAIGHNLNTVIIMFEFEPFNTVIVSRYFCVFFDLQSLWPKNWEKCACLFPCNIDFQTIIISSVHVWMLTMAGCADWSPVDN